MEKSDGKIALFAGKPSTSSDIKPFCKHFLNGFCRFGFTGKGKGSPKVPVPLFILNFAKSLWNMGMETKGVCWGPTVVNHMQKCVMNL